MNRILSAGFLLLLLSGCGSLSDQEETIPHYQFDKPEKFNLPESLLEVSGITFHDGNNDTIYAVQDEQGRVFRLAWDIKRQYNTKFSKQGDYEDLAIVNGQVIVLKSNGSFFRFPFTETFYEEADDVQEWKKILPKGEYEGMYADPATGQLYVICKKCRDDDPKKMVSGFILDAGDSISITGQFSIDTDQIEKIAGKIKRGFRPSGLARNPITSEWFVISSVNKLLVVADSNWNIKQACKLNGNVFNQPEGIAFDKAGNLYISNEGDDLSEGNILKFIRS